MLDCELTATLIDSCARFCCRQLFMLFAQALFNCSSPWLVNWVAKLAVLPLPAHPCLLVLLVQAMLECSSPWLVNLVATAQDDKNIYMLLEAVMGGELFAYLQVQGHCRFELCVESLCILFVALMLCVAWWLLYNPTGALQWRHSGNAQQALCYS
jgi:hypothetical protein